MCKPYHWLLVAATVAVKLLICSLVAFMALSVPPVQPCVPSVDF